MTDPGWTLQSVAVLIGGIFVTGGLWTLFLWSVMKDDSKRK